MFNVSASNACPWSAVSDVGWITVTSGASSGGNGKVDYDVARNTGPGRTGTIKVGTAVFTVTQAGTGS
jgi:hypothetical protein